MSIVEPAPLRLGLERGRDIAGADGEIAAASRGTKIRGVMAVSPR